MNASDMLNTCKSNVVFVYRTVEDKVANGCVTRGNLPNSLGRIPKKRKQLCCLLACLLACLLLFDKAKKRCLMSLRSIR